jgi:hypothetical protein
MNDIAYKLGFGARRRAEVDQQLRERYNAAPRTAEGGVTPRQRLAESYVRRAEAAAWQREPLATNQHILHLLVTVFTFGLWAPVWIILAIRGNRRR